LFLCAPCVFGKICRIFSTQYTDFKADP